MAFSAETKNMFTAAMIAVVAVLIAVWLSPWYRGMLVTGGKVPPPPETQAT